VSCFRIPYANENFKGDECLQEPLNPSAIGLSGSHPQPARAPGKSGVTAEGLFLNMPKFLSVKNWEKYQARTDKELPWLKLWGKLFDRPWWQELDDRFKVIPIIFLDSARRFNNKMPKNSQYYLRNYNLKLTEKEFVLVCKSLQYNDFLSDIASDFCPTAIILSPSPSPSPSVVLEDCKKPFGEAGLVRLKDDEYLKLVQKYGQAKTDAKITNLENYIGSKGNKYKSHYHTILNWDNKDRKDGKNNNDDGLTRAQRITLKGLERYNERRNPKQSDHVIDGGVSGGEF